MLSFHLLFVSAIVIVIWAIVSFVVGIAKIGERLAARPKAPPAEIPEIAFYHGLAARRAPAMKEWGKTHPYPRFGGQAAKKAHFEASKAYAESLN